MTSVPSPIHPHHYADNGLVPTVRFYQQIADGANVVALARGKCAWRSPGRVRTILAAGGAGQRNRWRGHIHTPPLCAQLGVYMITARSATSGGLTDPYTKFSCSGGVLGFEHHYGNTLATPSDVPSEWGHMFRYVDCAADTDYEIAFSDVDNGRLVSACVWTVGDVVDVANGYLERNIAVGQPIFDADSSAAMQLTTAQFNRAGATCWSWSADTDASARTRTSTTDINLIDNSSTAVSGSTPGVELDLRYMNSSSATTVAFRLLANAKVAGGAGGHVYLKDSAGTVLATITVTSTTAGWTSTTVNLPASVAKYDLHFDGDGANLITVYAVSLYQYA